MDRFYARVLLIAVICWTLMPCALAQGSDEQSATPAASATLDTTPPTYVRKEAFAVHSVDGASPLDIANSLWNNSVFALSSVSLTQSYYLDGSPAQGSSGHLMTIMSSAFAMDRYIGRTRFALQYKPQVSIVDGEVMSDLLNQTATLNFAQQLAPRLSMSLSDSFSYLGNRQFNGNPMSMDPRSGSIFQQNYLRGTGRVLSDSVSAGFSYQTSARATVSVTPFYTYANTTGNAGTTSNVDASYIGATTNLSYALSPRRNIGGYYSHQSSIISSSTGANQFESFGLNYSEQTGTYVISAQGGGSYVHGGSTAALEASANSWTGTGSLQVSKMMKDSSIALMASRSEAFAGVISASMNDRVDLTYSRHLGRKTSFSAGGGFFRTLQSSVSSGRDHGKYVSGQVQYDIAPGIQSFFAINHVIQSGDGTQVTSGGWTYFSLGITWGRIRNR